MGLTLSHAGHTLFHMDTPPTRTEHFGDQVAARIEASGLSIRAVSEATGIPLTTLHRRLRAESMSFTLGELTRIASLLGTTAGAIVTDFERAA